MRIVSALMFFPRGGSAHVARALARALPAHGCEVTLLSGSLRGRDPGDARAFYSGLRVETVDFGDGAPMHPSYEDRPGAPDPVFASVDDYEYEQHVATWAEALERCDAASADVLHLHHLTPINEAATRVAPDVPIVGHLHGTELLMLERIAAGAPPSWRHASAWARRMRRWARSCARLLMLSASQLKRAQDLLGVAPEALTVIPNGFDADLFRPAAIDRREHWRRHLVESPRGWRPGAGAGSVAYSDSELAPLEADPVLLCVGRFTAVKRTGLVVRAFARAKRDGASGSLVLLGGFPGEWEGEHPYDAVQESGARDVYLAGWHDHAALPDFFNASDAVVLGSVREQFGAVLVEGMACGLPPIAVASLGPAEIIDDGETGWLVEPDDLDGMAAAIGAALGDADERRRRGRNARKEALARYSWSRLAGRLADTLAEVVERPRGG